ncbi:MAG TPA: hypothetical protein VGC65_00190 [Bacteroidia bacterium]|jgi:hypothetical protein
MDKVLMAYIEQRMRELRFTEYTFQPIRVQDASDTIEFFANNEFYYLVAKTLPATMEIISDTNYFTDAANYGDFNFYGIQEFTGHIKITGGVIPVDCEFIRVIPTLTREKLNTVDVDALLEETYKKK